MKREDELTGRLCAVRTIFYALRAGKKDEL
jgi:hypothetical protein